MASLSDRSNSANPLKAIVMGDSGTGKSGALASLAMAGYRLMILDFDEGLDVIISAIKGWPSATDVQRKAALSRIFYQSCRDKRKAVGNGAQIIGLPTAWTTAANALSSWKEGGVSFGACDTWGLDTVLVIDSVTGGCEAAMNFILGLNARLNTKPHQSDWGMAQEKFEEMVQMVTSPDVKCNVILNCHTLLYEVRRDTGMRDAKGEAITEVLDTKVYPRTIGKALSPILPTYFNHTLLAARVGERRFLSTRPIGITEAKSSMLDAAREYPLATGLADYFRAFHGPLPKPWAPAVPAAPSAVPTAV